MRIEFSSSIREIDAAVWDSLVHASGAPVFYEHAYISAYEQAPLINADYSACFLMWDGEKLVGMLPVYLQSAVNPLRRLHEVYPEARGGPALLSHTWHCYDTHVPATAEVLPVLLDAMAQAASALGARWYGFVNVQRGGALSRDLRAAGLPARHLTDRWVTDLGSYENYLARLGIRARANLRRNERRSREAGVAIEIFKASDDQRTQRAPVISFSVDDIDAAHAALRTRGLGGEKPIVFHDAKFILFDDPDGNTLEVIQLGRGARSMAEVGAKVLAKRRAAPAAV